MPMPGASRIVSRRSAASAANPSSNSVTGAASARRRGSGYFTIGRIVTRGTPVAGHRMVLWRHRRGDPNALRGGLARCGDDFDLDQDLRLDQLIDDLQHERRARLAEEVAAS